MARRVPQLDSEETEALRELARPGLTKREISDNVLKHLIELGYAVNRSTGPAATLLGKDYLLPRQRK